MISVEMATYTGVLAVACTNKKNIVDICAYVKLSDYKKRSFHSDKLHTTVPYFGEFFVNFLT